MSDKTAGIEATLRELRRSRDFSPLVAAIPYATMLGLEVRFEQGDPLTVMRGTDRNIGNPVLPALHGGTVGALLESAAIFKLLWASQVTEIPKTINVTVDYLRSGRVEDTFARAVITKQGRRVANVHVSAWQSDPERPIATAHAHFLLKA